MAQHQIALQRFEIGTADDRVGQQAEAGVHAVDGRAAVDDCRDGRGTRGDARTCLVGQLDPDRSFIDLAQPRQRQWRIECEAHDALPIEGRFNFFSRAVAMAIS